MPGRHLSSDGMARAVAAYLARRLTRTSGREVAAVLGYRTVSRVSVACRRVGGATADRTFAAELDELLRAVPTNHESRPGPVCPRDPVCPPCGFTAPSAA